MAFNTGMYAQITAGGPHPGATASQDHHIGSELYFLGDHLAVVCSR